MGKINHTSFVKLVSKKTGYAQKDIKAVLEAAVELAVEQMKEGNEATALPGLTLYAKYMESRPCRNPRTGEMTESKAHYNPKAKFGKDFRW